MLNKEIILEDEIEKFEENNYKKPAPAGFNYASLRFLHQVAVRNYHRLSTESVPVLEK